jgi:hypothetical protein
MLQNFKAMPQRSRLFRYPKSFHAENFSMIFEETIKLERDSELKIRKLFLKQF